MMPNGPFIRKTAGITRIAARDINELQDALENTPTLDDLQSPVNLKGVLTTTGDLPSSGNTTGDAYIVSGMVWVWNGTAWTDQGSLTQGPQGEAGVLRLKGTVATVGALPASGNVINDVWIVTADSHGYGWTGLAWVDLGPFQGPAGPGGIDTVLRARVDPGTTGAARQRITVNPSGVLTWVNEDVANVMHFGAKGDGSTDDAAAIQAACNSGASTVVFPTPPAFYRTLSSITPLTGQTLKAMAGYRVGFMGMLPIRIGGQFDGPTLVLSADDVTVRNIYVSGNRYTSGSLTLSDVGMLVSGSFCSIINCKVIDGGGPGIKITAGLASQVARCFIGDVLMAHASLTDYAGGIDVSGTDHYVHHNEFGGNGAANANGYVCAGHFRSGGGHFVSDNVFELSETGAYVHDNVAGCSFVGNRADLNKRHGWMVDGAYHTFSSNKAHNNGQIAANTYDGFYVNAWASTFMGSSILQTDAPGIRYGFYDFSDGPANDLKNIYIGSVLRGTVGTGFYSMPTGSRFIDFHNVAQAYTATNVTTDRSYSATATTVAELGNVLGTLIADLRAQGLVV